MKPRSIARIVGVVAAGLVSSSALAQDGPAAASEPNTGTQAVELLTEYCVPDMSADVAEAVLIANGWNRIGRFSREEIESGAIPEETVAEMNRMRVFNNEAFPHIITFTTARATPNIRRDCSIDGRSIDPVMLVRALISAYGAPALAENGTAHWANWQDTEHILIIGASFVENHDFEGGLQVVLRKEPPSE